MTEVLVGAPLAGVGQKAASSRHVMTASTPQGHTCPRAGLLADIFSLIDQQKLIIIQKKAGFNIEVSRDESASVLGT